jgi:hypothetical protein
MTQIEERVDDLLKRIERLEDENARLRAEHAPAGEEEAGRNLDRRHLIRWGTAAVAAGAAGVLLRPSAAAAASGGQMILGQDNDAGSDPTGLTSASSTVDTLHLSNTGGGITLNVTGATTKPAAQVVGSQGGEALHVHTTNALNNNPAVHIFDDGRGGCLFAEQTSSDPLAGPAITALGANGGLAGTTEGPGAGVQGQADVGTGPAVLASVPDVTRTSTAVAVEAAHNAKGHGVYSHIDYSGSSALAVYGLTVGSNNAVRGTISNAANAASAVRGITNGKGAGIEGSSSAGVGGKFSGPVAQLYLVPSTAASHPTSSARGAIFVDKYGRLWFCKGGTSWKQLA